MISMKKRGLCLILLLCTVFMTIAGYTRSAKAATTYNNTSSASISSYVDSNGKLHSLLIVTGIKGITTLIEADLYVEKRILGIFWKKIDIGYPNNIWHDSTTSFHFYNEFITQLPSTGTYRVKVTYTVSGSGGSADIIPITDNVTY